MQAGDLQSRNEAQNYTVTEFVLLGLSPNHEVQMTLFFFFLIFYMVILPGNVLIILTVWRDSQLRSPMYFFLANLTFLDICYCSVTPPKMLADFFSHRKTISYNACMAQIFFLHFLGAAEAFLLIAMAYDCYIAVCKPLHYTRLMNRGVCCVLVGASWGRGFLHGIILLAFSIHLPLCGPNILNNFFCDIHQLVNLACGNTYTVELLMFLNNGAIIVVCFVLLLMSYTALLLKLQTQSSKAKNKVASTCISHIIVVFVMWGPAVYIYSLPFQAVPREKVVAVFHTVVFPLTNPMIYTWRNQEIKGLMWKLVSKA
ncbi:LOW QUALITY PROTEIN: olfactory receptor 734-like [Indicator indicator]|uniref:LOW QUALITY PROTEIN: olfactory receptor 734-like n=1 Tax=Indicator indicator TaxID=1002788 RepID=UPI0023DECD94|nr:LOW QUALITY PROTEIN: olfactory receptor 734-like [Indicator indicator]